MEPTPLAGMPPRQLVAAQGGHSAEAAASSGEPLAGAAENIGDLVLSREKRGHEVWGGQG